LRTLPVNDSLIFTLCCCFVGIVGANK